MTKEEVLAEIRIHSAAIRAIIASLEYKVLTLTQGNRIEYPDQVSGLKSMMDSLKGKVDEIKDVLDEWPKS